MCAAQVGTDSFPLLHLFLAMDHTNLLRQLDIRPTADEARNAYNQEWTPSTQPTLLPVCASAPADLLTPSAIYLKLSSG